MKHKISFLILIILFLVFTIIAYSIETPIKRVVIINRNAVLKQETVQIETKVSEVQQLNFASQILTTTEPPQKKISDTDSVVPTVQSKQAIKKFDNVKKEHEAKQYKYENISWNEWKSNFINQFLEDSATIPSLDNYGIGSWFYYSFDVTYKGEIRNVRVFSFNLSARDKKLIRDMIYGYAFKDITVFPKNSRRKKVKIDAIVVLSDAFINSDPSDFNDNERVRIEY